MEVGAASLQNFFAHGGYNAGETVVERICKGDVTDDAGAEEGRLADALGAVEDLVRYDEVPWADIFFQTSDGGESDDGAHAEGAQGGDVCEVGDFAGEEVVVRAVAGEECDGLHGVRGGEDSDGGGGGTPGGRGVEDGEGFEAGRGEGGDAGAADDGEAHGGGVGGGEGGGGVSHYCLVVKAGDGRVALYFFAFFPIVSLVTELLPRLRGSPTIGHTHTMAIGRDKFRRANNYLSI